MNRVVSWLAWRAWLYRGVVLWSASVGLFVVGVRLVTGTGASLVGVLDDSAFVLAMGAAYAALESTPRALRSALLPGLAIVLATLFLANALHLDFFGYWLGAGTLRMAGDLPAAWSSVVALLGMGVVVHVLAVPGAVCAAAVRSAISRPPLRSGGLAALLGALAALVLLLRQHPGPGSDPADQNPALFLLRDGVERLWASGDQVSVQVIAHERAHTWNSPSPERYLSGDSAEWPLLRKPVERATDTQAGLGQKNVVLIVLESVRSREIAFGSDGPSAMPHLRRLAREGLFFSRHYAAADFTVRGELAVLCGTLPDMGRGTIYGDHPELELSCLPSILGERGWRNYWVSAYHAWYANKAEFLKRHGFHEIHDLERFRGRAMRKPELGWGPSDEDMYAYALEVLDRAPPPFFAELMTLSNHHPWEDDYGLPYPPGFDLTLEEAPQRGYLRGLYYTDAALHGFLESARTRDWFSDTIFVIVADHGTWTRPSGLPASQTHPLRIEAAFRTPLVFWSPAHVPAGERQFVASQIDVAPTVLDLLGIRARNAWMGVSLLDALDPAQRFALLPHGASWHFRRGDRYCYSEGADAFSTGLDLLGLDAQSFERSVAPLSEAACRPLCEQAKRLVTFNRWLIDHDRIQPARPPTAQPPASAH